jgi:hypothetical protein
MDEEGLNCFEVRRALSGMFYRMRQGRSICTRTGTVRYFETESDVLEFLAEIDDTELN